MDVNKIKKIRAPLRAAITRAFDKFQREGLTELEVKIIKDKGERLLVLDEQYKNEAVEQEEYEDELLTIEEYREKFIILTAKEEQEEKPFSDTKVEQNRLLRLPQIQIPKFNGDASQWLAFWGQFKKVHLDKTLTQEDKFHYLLQSVEGRAKDVVLSYPPSAGNYEKVLSQVKNRFAKDTVIVEYYIRELLNLVFQQVSGSLNLKLHEIYDKLNSYIQNLDTLEIYSDQSAPFVLPLVEACLPQDILKEWEKIKITFSNKSKNSEYDSLHGSVLDLQEPENAVSRLMQFLQLEVESSERLRNVRALVDNGQMRDDQNFTISALVRNTQGKNVNETIKCLFRTKSHASQDCFKAQEMKLEEKQRIIREKRVCFSCLKPNHNSKNCKSFVKCAICKKKHFVILCPQLPSIQMSRLKESVGSMKEGPSCSNLNNFETGQQVLLQTL